MSADMLIGYTQMSADKMISMSAELKCMQRDTDTNGCPQTESIEVTKDMKVFTVCRQG